MRAHGLLAPLVVTALLACSASRAPGEGAPAIDIPRLFESEMGYSIAEVNAAALEGWAAAVKECLIDAGFTPLKDTIPDGASRLSPPVKLGGLVRTVSNVMLPAPTDPEQPQQARALSRAYSTALSTCMETASSIVVDPSASFMAWLAAEDHDLAARVLGDQRVVVANAELASCLGAAGTPARTEDDVVAYFQTRAQAVASDLHAGTISDAVAQEQLAQLDAEEQQVAPAGNACIEHYRAEYDEVLEEQRSLWVGDHLAAVTETLHRLRDTNLRSVTRFLSKHG